MYDLTVYWEKIKKSSCLPPEWGGGGVKTKAVHKISCA